MGENVRYDGGHSRDRFVTDTLSRWFEFVPVCPEVEIGMTTPTSNHPIGRRRPGDSVDRALDR